MIAELREDNLTLVARMKDTHERCANHTDCDTISLVENWIDKLNARDRN